MMFHCLVVAVAEGLQQLGIRQQMQHCANGPRFQICLRIVDGDDAFQVADVDAAKSFSNSQRGRGLRPDLL
jgi:hypothetical protein